MFGRAFRAAGQGMRGAGARRASGTAGGFGGMPKTSGGAGRSSGRRQQSRLERSSHEAHNRNMKTVIRVAGATLSSSSLAQMLADLLACGEEEDDGGMRRRCC
eukprot:TRINITY_DN7170_c0_g1_i2.p1 TRINITY_DN7170_c0_g1~~TRINITY_DN7170_c0_g1_i2.p1  ORF type:complete len:103 (+),score=14.66 TRINITY_DN7170_c0_g1_i2:63-371(+)